MTTDVAALKTLWQQAFGDPPEFIEGFFSVGFSPDRCCCVYKDDKLAAALYWFDCQWGKKRLAYIYAVATDPQFRGQGLCKKLMDMTHRQLARQGYAGTVLVPAQPELFVMYEKMGYRGFCPMGKKTVLPGGPPVQAERVTAARYDALRQVYQPEDSIMQRGKTLEFLGTYAGFYAFDGGAFSAAWEENTLYIQEFLGDAGSLPGILELLGADKAVVRLPGGEMPFAMYHSLTGDDSLPSYLGIALD